MQYYIKVARQGNELFTTTPQPNAVMAEMMWIYFNNTFPASDGYHLVQYEIETRVVPIRYSEGA